MDIWLNKKWSKPRPKWIEPGNHFIPSIFEPELPILTKTKLEARSTPQAWGKTQFSSPNNGWRRAKKDVIDWINHNKPKWYYPQLILSSMMKMNCYMTTYWKQKIAKAWNPSHFLRPPMAALLKECSCQMFTCCSQCLAYCLEY